MGRRTFSIVLVCALVAGMAAVTSPPAHALSAPESCFVQAINRERARVGRRGLAVYSDLTAIARRHSRRMAEDGTIYHNSRLGSEISGDWYAAGENVGMGPSCGSIHDAFMSSPDHRSNILEGDYNQVGVGVVVKDDTIYVTEVFAGRRGSRPRPQAPVRRVSRSRPPAPPPKTKPKPPAPPPSAEPRTLQLLLMLVGLDAERVNPTTGAAPRRLVVIPSNAVCSWSITPCQQGLRMCSQASRIGGQAPTGSPRFLGARRRRPS